MQQKATCIIRCELRLLRVRNIVRANFKRFAFATLQASQYIGKGEPSDTAAETA